MPGSGRLTNEVKIRAAAMAMSSLAKMDKKGKGQTISFRLKLSSFESVTPTE